VKEYERRDKGLWTIGHIQKITPQHVCRVYRKYKDCKNPVLKKCRRKPRTISSEERKLIVNTYNEYLVGAAMVELILNEKGIHINHNRIHKIMLEEGLAKHEENKQKQRRYKCYQRKHSLSLVHTDWAEYKKEKFILFEDDASRFILASGKFEHATKDNVIKIFRKSLKYGVYKMLHSDNGSVFKTNKQESKNRYFVFKEVYENPITVPTHCGIIPAKKFLGWQFQGSYPNSYSKRWAIRDTKAEAALKDEEAEILEYTLTVLVVSEGVLLSLLSGGTIAAGAVVVPTTITGLTCTGIISAFYAEALIHTTNQVFDLELGDGEGLNGGDYVMVAMSITPIGPIYRISTGTIKASAACTTEVICKISMRRVSKFFAIKESAIVSWIERHMFKIKTPDGLGYLTKAQMKNWIDFQLNRFKNFYNNLAPLEKSKLPSWESDEFIVDGVRTKIKWWINPQTGCSGIKTTLGTPDTFHGDWYQWINNKWVQVGAPG